MKSGSGFQPLLRKWDQPCATAAMGDRGSIQKLQDTEAGINVVPGHRLGPLLATRMHRDGLQPPPEWRTQLRQTAVTRMILEQARLNLGHVLDSHHIPWLPLKGMGAITDIYPQPECRPTSDLDILIPREKLETAIPALTGAGWIPIDDDEFEPMAIYNWKASHPNGSLLELHYTLWGGVDSRLAEGPPPKRRKSAGAGPLRPSLPSA